TYVLKSQPSTLPRRSLAIRQIVLCNSARSASLPIAATCAVCQGRLTVGGHGRCGEASLWPVAEVLTLYSPFHSPPALHSQRWRPRNGLVERWARLGSNQRPPACEAGALPLSYAPRAEHDS